MSGSAKQVDTGQKVGLGSFSQFLRVYRRGGTPFVVGARKKSIRPTAGSLRSDCRQGSSPLRGAPLVPRSAFLTASSLRLQSFWGGWRSLLSNEQSVDDCLGGGKLKSNTQGWVDDYENPWMKDRENPC